MTASSETWSRAPNWTRNFSDVQHLQLSSKGADSQSEHMQSNASKGNKHPSDLRGLLTWASSPSREAHEVEHVVI